MNDNLSAIFGLWGIILITTCLGISLGRFYEINVNQKALNELTKKTLTLEIEFLKNKDNIECR